MSKSEAIVQGVVGIGAVVMMVGVRSCDDFFRASRIIDDVPASSVMRSYDDVYKTSDLGITSINDVYKTLDGSIASLDDVLSGNTRGRQKTITYDDDMIPIATGGIDALELEKTLHGEHIHYSGLDKVRHVNLDENWFESVNSPKILSLFPSNKVQYKNVYGSNPSITAESKIEAFRNKISSDPSLIGKDLYQSDLIFTAIRDSDGSPVVILAHSEDGGRRVIFPDGSSMDITDVHTQCIEALKRCMVLTCHGDDFDITENISATDALAIWKTVSKKALARDDVSVNDLVKAAKTLRAKQKTRKMILISLAASSSLGTPFLKVSLQSDEKLENSGI